MNTRDLAVAGTKSPFPEHLVDEAPEVVVVDTREYTEWPVVEFVSGNVTTEVRLDRVQILLRHQSSEQVLLRLSANPGR